jgi:hypothetical protein
MKTIRGMGMKNRIITILLECLIFLIGAGVSSAQTISSITVYEDSSGVQPFNFLITDPALYNTGSIDFRQLVGEDYDLYFSDEDGILSANGMYLTITCTHNYFFNENSAANNIDAVSLNFSDGSKAWASIVTSYTLGWNQTLGWANLGAALGQPDGVSTRVGSQYSSLTVGFAPPSPQYTLVVANEGTGEGSVTSIPSGIDCEPSCSQFFSEGTVVRLTATPETGSAFAYWSGGCSGTTETCDVNMTGNIEVAANFMPLETMTLYVNLENADDGKVTSVPPGIDCEPTCSETFFVGTQIRLTAIPYAGWDFAYWSGGCTGTIDTCDVTMTGNIEVAANFVPVESVTVYERTAYVLPFTFPMDDPRLEKNSGFGQESFDFTFFPGGTEIYDVYISDRDGTPNMQGGMYFTIECKRPWHDTGIYAGHNIDAVSINRSDGTHIWAKEVTAYTLGYSQTLEIANPNAALGPPDDICTYMGDQFSSLTVGFGLSKKQNKLKIKKVRKNRGDGVVTSNDGNINCGETCSHIYYKENVVMENIVALSAAANQGSTFTGWSPASLNCTGANPCTVSIDKAKTVQAVFVGDYRLKVVTQSKKGGTGTVTSIPSGISCPTGSKVGCETTYPYAEQVTLSASADSGSTFLGWNPAKLCPGTGSCTVPMDKKHTIKAVFSGQ